MKTVSKIITANLPTIYGRFQIIIYKTLSDNKEHVVLLKGNELKGSTLVRIHSRCLTGDVFSSKRCDCRDQLITSLKKIGKSKNGILIYLNQEGRGIGLSNKIKAYRLQDGGLDTIEANEQLGFAADPRSYKVAAQILKDLGISQVTLLTNNPDKANQLKAFGINIIDCIPLETTPNDVNKSYLKTKKEKLGHKLSLV